MFSSSTPRRLKHDRFIHYRKVADPVPTVAEWELYPALVAIRDAVDRPVEVALVASVTDDFKSKLTVPERQEWGRNLSRLLADIIKFDQ